MFAKPTIAPAGRPSARRIERDPERAEPREAVRALDRGGDERRARPLRDARGAGVRPRLPALAETLPLPRPLGEHDHHLAGTDELHGRRDRLHVTPAALDR